VCGDQGGVDVKRRGPRGVDAGVRGQKPLAATRLSGPSRTRVHSQLWLITALHFGIELFAKLVADRLPPGYTAETGDITHFGAPEQLTSWAGLTPKRDESDATVHRGRITKQGSRLVRWAAVEAVQRVPAHTRLGQIRDRIGARRGRREQPTHRGGRKPSLS